MKQILIGMLAETFVHPGVGQAISAIDLPVARERTTDYPIIPGSGQKGGWKTWAKEQAGLSDAETKILFGEAENAGAVMFSDARLLLLPVRSLNTAYVWLTCPYLLERLERDITRIGGAAGILAANIEVAPGGYLSPTPVPAEAFKELPSELALEEREFTRQGDLPASEKAGVLAALEKLAPTVAARIAPQLAIVHNDDFAWFAKYALPVSAHNALDPQKKTSNALWYEETLPPDTVMYAILAERKDTPGAVEKIKTGVGRNPYCQFGGNETVGQGWFKLAVAFESPAAQTADPAKAKEAA